jgi:hypothetical protein
MYNQRQLIWIGAGMIVALLTGILATIIVQAAIQAIIWTPVFISSAAWNHAPV